MRTTRTLVVCSLLAGCVAPVGKHGDDDRPDAGSTDPVAACDQVKRLSMNLTISSTANFSNLPATCWELDGELRITGPALTSVAKLGDLRTVRDLVVTNTGLTTFDSKNPIDVTGTITISDNSKLTSLANIVPITSVTGIDVEYNTALVGLGGISSVPLVTGPITIVHNDALATVDFKKVRRIENGSLTIDSNALVSNIDLSRLESVGGALAIRNNAALVQFAKLDVIQFIHGDFRVENNAQLQSLALLASNVTTVDGGVVITGNPKLVDLGKASWIGTILGASNITNNAILPFCRAHEVWHCTAHSSAFSLPNGNTSGCTCHCAQ